MSTPERLQKLIDDASIPIVSAVLKEQEAALEPVRLQLAEFAAAITAAPTEGVPEFTYTQKPNGKCPVQANGLIDGKEFYFRARGGHWYVAVAGEQGDVFGTDAWKHSEKFSGRNAHTDAEIGDGRMYAAGWADEDECEAFIARVLAIYKREIARSFTPGIPQAPSNQQMAGGTPKEHQIEKSSATTDEAIAREAAEEVAIVKRILEHLAHQPTGLSIREWSIFCEAIHKLCDYSLARSAPSPSQDTERMENWIAEHVDRKSYKDHACQSCCDRVGGSEESVIAGFKCIACVCMDNYAARSPSHQGEKGL